jgi:uncharacterized membrane protein YkoI
MINTRLFATTAAFLLASAGGALAVPHIFHSHAATQAELAAAQAGAGSLNRAIAAVEGLTGGHVVEIHFDEGSGAGFYDATVAHDGTLDHAVVNLKTKQVAMVDQAHNPVRTFDFRDRTTAEMVVRSSKVGLSNAVADAEQASRGVAIAARTTRSQDGYMLAHDIETVKGDMVRPVLIDAKTGLVIGDPQAFATQP